MYLSKLTPDTTAHAFRRDFGDLHQMHRTVMSGFPDLPDDTPAREHHGVLWRIDAGQTGYTLYVQSRTAPDWTHLTLTYLAKPAEIRDLTPVLDTLQPGRTLAFRLVANPTRRRTDPTTAPSGERRRDARFPLRDPEDQIVWLLNQGQRHGFTIPTGAHARPDCAPFPCARLTGRQPTNRRAITVDPVRYDGHLVITDPTALATAVTTGIGPAKAYGCGLLTLAPAHQR